MHDEVDAMVLSFVEVWKGLLFGMCMYDQPAGTQGFGMLKTMHCAPGSRARYGTVPR